MPCDWNVQRQTDALYEVLPQVCGEMASYPDIDSKLHINQQTAVDPLNQPIQYMDAQLPPPKKNETAVSLKLSHAFLAYCKRL